MSSSASSLVDLSDEWALADVRTREFLIDHAREDDDGRTRAEIDREELDRQNALEHTKLRRKVAHAETAGYLRATILRLFRRRATRAATDSYERPLHPARVCTNLSRSCSIAG